MLENRRKKIEDVMKKKTKIFLIVGGIILIILILLVLILRESSHDLLSIEDDPEVIRKIQKISEFNSNFINYTGRNKEQSDVKELLEKISSNNETQENTDGHVISVTLIDENGNYLLENSNDMTSIYECISNVDGSKKYVVTITETDSEGYYTAMTIIEESYYEKMNDSSN